MKSIDGLRGYIPNPKQISDFVCPPYDVIKKGSQLEELLGTKQASLMHVTLGSDPKLGLERLIKDGVVQAQNKPTFIVTVQKWTSSKGPQERYGFFAAPRVSPYEEKKVIRHEKTFDDKVKGRMALRKATGLTLEPIFLLTQGKINGILKEAASRELYARVSPDYQGLNDLHAVETTLFLVNEDDPLFVQLQDEVSKHPLYIADGHHRYHAALQFGQSHCMAYITEDATILAYNRVVRGTIPFAEIKGKLNLVDWDAFATPPKNHFAIYHQGRSYLLPALHVPVDVVGKLDCSILERELYPHLGLSHSMIMDERHFDYYPESMLGDMRAVVDAGTYDLAIALHPVSKEELLGVADAGLLDSNVVMPEKSTFFAPKVLSGLCLLDDAQCG